MNIINRFTLQSLKRNKVRTFVTIIGIILSTAMFTGVTSLIYSFQAFMVDLEVSDYGTWEGRFTGISQEQSQTLCKDKEITNSTVIKNTGYAQLENCLNEDKPYLCIQAFQDSITDLFPIHIVQGRMPKSDGEILIPSHLSDNGGISYQLGDTLNLNVGTRLLADGDIGFQYDAYTGSSEKLEGLTQKEYTVVGICDRPRMEDYFSPGYTAFIVDNGKDLSASCDVFFQVKDAKNIEAFMKSYQKQFKKDSPKVDFLVHSELLRMQGKSSGRTYNKILWSMGSIFIIIIMVASISLIYNAISISVSERIKDFGLLKSIGATKKQIRKSVLFEALFLCLIGIPIGIGSGLIGIGITLHYVAKLILQFLNVSDSVELKLTFSALAILSAAVIALVTVLLSALIPARRAMKMPAIQALMESNEIRLRRKKLRSSRLTYRLFGLEGMLANKNFKRNRRKYRMTVFSITISIVLFLGTSSFSNYMVQTINLFDTASIYDIDFYMLNGEFKGDINPEHVKNDIAKLKGVDNIAYTTSVNALLQLDASQVTDDYLKLQKDYKGSDYCKKVKSTGKIAVPVFVTFVEDVIYEDYLEEHQLNVSRFMDTKNLCPLIWDDIAYYEEDGGVTKINILSGDTDNGKLFFYKLDLNKMACEVTDPATLSLEYYEEIEDEEGDESWKQATRDEGLVEAPMLGSRKMDEKLPLGVTDMSWSFDQLRMILPYSALDTLPSDIFPPDTIDFGILAKDHKTAYEEMSHFFQNSNNYSHAVATRIFDGKEERESMNALILVMDIFSYGFIALITLIVMANIFHTISTNVQLRRKEFASLKSIGMTRKGFDKMMNYECLLYGLKGLIYGLPISFLICYLMFRSLQDAWNVPFMIPWLSVAIAVVSVFVIVFASMFYSMHKIKKDNPIDALRENV